MKHILWIMAMTILTAACSNNGENIIGKNNPEIRDGKLTPEVLWAFGRIGNVQVSPDGKKILYSVSYYSVAEDKSNAELFVMNVDGTEKQQITNTAVKETAAKWMNDNEHIAFLSAKSGSMQLWIMNAQGDDRKQITKIEGGISDFLFSPDESKLLFVADVKYGERTVDKHPDLPKSTGIIVTDLMYKHWDEWVQTVPHPFVVDFQNDEVGTPKDLLEGEPFESPMKPWGGIEQLAWSPDNQTIASTCRKKTGQEYAFSTNSDIYFYDLKTGKSKNVTEGMMGYDQNPVFSPDGQ